MDNNDLHHKNNKRSKPKIIKRLIIIFAILIGIPFLLIIQYFFSEQGTFINSIFTYQWHKFEFSESKSKAIEKEFGLIIPPNWEITRFTISSGRELRSSITMEGELNDINNIREYIPYTLPNNIYVNVKNQYGNFSNKTPDRIPDLEGGLISFSSDNNDNYYRVRLSKSGLKNKWLHF